MASGNGAVQSRQGMNGNYQKNNVVEIDLSVLAINSFKHWRVLIVLMIAFALIFGGAKAVKSKSEIKALESEEKLSEKENEEKASDMAVSEDDTDSEMPQEYVQYENTKDFEGSKALSKADSVVLIESKSSSKISDIREEISEIGKIGKNLAGIILVD